MSDSDSIQRDNILDKLMLDLKALVLLSENDDQLLKTAKESVINSHDEQIVKFISMIRPAPPSESRRGTFLTAISQLILASFLTVLGLSLLAPSLMGLQSPGQLLSYFRQIVDGLSASSFSNPLLPALDFLFALLLLLGSFYLLRHSAVDLKESGLS